jgi:hypothetical protein
VGSTRTKTLTPPQRSTRRAGCWGTGSSRPPRPVMPRCWPGWARSGSWCGSGLKVEGSMGLAWLDFCRRQGWSWWRSTARIVRPAAGRVSPTRSTPRPPRGLLLAGRASGVPKTRGGKVDALRALRVARRSAVAARADAQRQIKALIVTAPDALRVTLGGLGERELIAYCAARRPDRAVAGAPTVATIAALAWRSPTRSGRSTLTPSTAWSGVARCGSSGRVGRCQRAQHATLLYELSPRPPASRPAP